MKPAWWVPSLILIGVVLELSFLQVRMSGPRDIRWEAARTVFTVGPGYFGDPWPSVMAARRLRADSRALIYDQDLSIGSAFIYPPIAAALYRPFAALPDETVRRALSLVDHALFVLIVALLTALVAGRRAPRPAELACVCAAATIFYPLLHAVELNQATLPVTALLGGAFFALDRARPALAGALYAAAIAIKPQLALALPLLIWHAPRMIAATLAVGAALLAASLAWAGVANHVDYIERVLPALSRGYAYYANHSWNGFFQRLFTDTDLGFFALPPPSAWAAGCAAVASLASYGAGLFFVRRLRGRPELATWVLGFAWLLTTTVSPIAWQHHYVPALFVLALVWRAFRDQPELRRPSLVLPSALAFALLASYFEVRSLRGLPSVLAVSYLFYGALLLLVTVARVAGAHGTTARR